MYFCLFFPNNKCTLPKAIDLTDFSASERSDKFVVGTILESPVSTPLSNQQTVLPI